MARLFGLYSMLCVLNIVQSNDPVSTSSRPSNERLEAREDPECICCATVSCAGTSPWKDELGDWIGHSHVALGAESSMLDAVDEHRPSPRDETGGLFVESSMTEADEAWLDCSFRMILNQFVTAEAMVLTDCALAAGMLPIAVDRAGSIAARHLAAWRMITKYDSTRSLNLPHFIKRAAWFSVMEVVALKTIAQVVIGGAP